LALKDHPITDLDKFFTFIADHFAVDGGFDFKADGYEGVWNEGTSQVGVLFAQYGKPEDAQGILNYLNANRLPDGSITSADRDGINTTFVIEGTDNLTWEYGKRQHLGATAWLSFLQESGRNPLAY
jgi:hypothetical protein